MIIENEMQVEYKLNSGKCDFLLTVRIRHDVKQINYSLSRNTIDPTGTIYIRNMNHESLNNFADMLKQVAVKIEEILTKYSKYKLVAEQKF